MRNAVTAIVIALACAGGLWLASVDARTDDTGVEAGLIFLIAGALSAVRPRAAVIVALLVGGFIPLIETADQLTPGRIPPGAVALVVTFVGALIGFAVARASRTSAAT